MKVAALLTAMDVPLGRAVGNALEVTEAVDVLEGRGPADLVEVTVALAEVMLELAGLQRRPPPGAPGRLGPGHLEGDGQGPGRRPRRPAARGRRGRAGAGRAAPGSSAASRRAPVGVAAWRLGAGRARKEDPVSASAGVRCLVKPGEPVEKGQPVLELHTDDPGRLERARQALAGRGRSQC